ncbi:non-canonical purine NTP pyrophosphatase [Tepidibacillus infernus]|uniref:non-canonical purine NTP pyrophosphatase n=1 Tax=Tepidibacillus infernus TaxID=1806172 RepID=UPI003A4636EF
MKLIFATTNSEKLIEAKMALAPFGFEVEDESFPFKEPTEGTMESIARYKLSQIEDREEPVFVDDSGIFFEAYPNFPGILTKRIFNLVGYKGIEKLLKEENRSAYFHGVIAMKWRNEIKVFHGELHGKITNLIPNDLPIDLKFPFDPIFIPNGYNKVLGEMPIEKRVFLSYRRIALEEMGKWLKNQLVVDKTS